MKMKWPLTIILVAGALGVLAFLQLGQNVVYFYTPEEAQAQAAQLSQKTIKVGGMVIPGSVQWKPDELSLKFMISDLKGHEIQVAHASTPPDLFKEGQGVVVQGRLAADGKSIASQKLMVKHSEEYKKPGDHASMDKALIEKSLFEK